MSNEEQEVVNNGAGNNPSLLGMITSPVEQFKRIKQKPVIFLPIVIIIILVIIGGWLNSQGLEIPELEELNELTDEAGGLMQTFDIIGTILVGIFIPLLFVSFYSVVQFLVGKTAQSEVKFKQLFSMNTFIFFISSIGTLINGIIIFIIGSSTGMQVTSIASILDNDNMTLVALTSWIEVFSIWTLILTAIGLHKVAGFSKGLSWAIPIILTILGILFSLVFGGIASV